MNMVINLRIPQKNTGLRKPSNTLTSRMAVVPGAVQYVSIETLVEKTSASLGYV